MTRPGLVLLILIVCSAPARAQSASDASAPSAQHQHQHAPSAHAELFPAREASGTAWLPDETPTYGVQRALGKWSVMLHGAAFGQFLYEPGDRHRTGGDSTHQISAVNWFMAMARRETGTGRVGVRAMMSIEPWTVSDCGFINLLANGETCDGDTIHDRQHPHDLFMELAAEYDRPVGKSLRWQIYGGLAGEPALGPAAFPHRPSAMFNPVAPISHHWLDSSHITFGLVTSDIYGRRWKAEASLFNGREPDEHRADLDLGALDSVSGRVTFLPTSRWALQVSAGHLRDAEADVASLPRNDVNRVTASATHQRVTASGAWATTIAYGVNANQETIPGEPNVDLVTHALLLETAFTSHERHTWFGRMEIVGKPGHDLHVHEDPGTVFGVTKLQAGYLRSFGTWKGIVTGVGGTASVSLLPSGLAARYFGSVSPSFGIFVSVRPARHAM